MGGGTLPDILSEEDFFRVNSHFREFGDWWLGAKAVRKTKSFLWSKYGTKMEMEQSFQKSNPI